MRDVRNRRQLVRGTSALTRENPRLLVVIAEDSGLIRQGIAALLCELGFEVVGCAGDVGTLMSLVERTAPSIAVVNLRLPPTRSEEGLRAALDIRARHPSVAVLILSSHPHAAHAMSLFELGARHVGYLLMDDIADAIELADAIRRLIAGDTVIDPRVVTLMIQRKRWAEDVAALTDRQREVLSLMAQGRSNLAIARRLSVAEKTVEAHVSSIFSVLRLEPQADDHRRVLAVLTYLRS